MKKIFGLFAIGIVVIAVCYLFVKASSQSVKISLSSSLGWSSSNLILNIGQTFNMYAVETDQFGNTITASTTWTSSNSSVATVDASGLVTIVGAGTASITASSGGVVSEPAVVYVYTQTSTTTINGITSQSSQTSNIGIITISAIPDLTVGQTFQIKVVVLDKIDNIIEAPVTWSSSNSAVATVDSSGLVTAVGSGTTNIIASSGGVMSDPSILNVSSEIPVVKSITISSIPSTTAGKTFQMFKSMLDQFGNVIIATTIWSSSNTSVATVDSGGLVVIVGPGSASITASSEGVDSNPSTVFVSAKAPTVSSIAVSSVPPLSIGQTYQMDKVVLDESNQVVTSTTTWSSSDTSVATVDLNGVVTIVGVGTANIIASNGGVASAPTVVSVSSKALAVSSIAISSVPTLVIGQTFQMFKSILDQNGNPIESTLTWVSSNSSVATVDSSGIVTAVGGGTANIIASSGGVNSYPSAVYVSAQAPTVDKILITW